MSTTLYPGDHRGRRVIGWKIASLLLICLLLAMVFNVAQYLLHIPTQMQHGILNPSLILLSEMILLGAILVASAWTVRFLDDRPLSTVGVPFSRSWLRQTGIGLLVSSIPPVLFLVTGYKLGSTQVERIGFAWSIGATSIV
jgi:hypothetical protein